METQKKKIFLYGIIGIAIVSLIILGYYIIIHNNTDVSQIENNALDSISSYGLEDNETLDGDLSGSTIENETIVLQMYVEPTSKTFISNGYKITQTGDELYYNINIDKNGNIKVSIPEISSYDKTISASYETLIEKTADFNLRKSQIETDGFNASNLVKKEFKAYNSLPIKDSKGNTITTISKTSKGDEYIYTYKLNVKEKYLKIGESSIELIRITDAEHLDSSKEFIENIYDLVYEQDDVWVYIPENDYIRTTFERVLTSTNDITLYANGTGSVDIYKKNDSVKIATIIISGENTYKQLLTGMSGVSQTFDLKFTGDVSVDYIVDPTPAFVSRWDTRFISTGSSNASNLTLPLVNDASSSYNFIVDWGDGTPNSTVTALNDVDKQHSYGLGGAYNITITGTLIGFRFANTGDRLKIVNISQFGILNLGNANGYFYGASNLNITATDILDLTGTNTMKDTFYNCRNITLVTNMYAWDTSQVTTMQSMFQSASAFNGNISNWDTHNVTTMASMFYVASNFNQSLYWNTSKVTAMNSMFSLDTNFNGNISNWDTHNVTTMASMFYSTAFNQPIENWNTSQVTTMYRMFYGATKFNGNISNWDTHNVANMASMFENANSFNQNLPNWNVSSVTTMASMFSLANSFNGNITSWDVHNVTDFLGMIGSAVFNQDISGWNTSKAIKMSFMFQNANSFNQDISRWDVHNVTTMQNMFDKAYLFNQPLGTWNVSSVQSMQNMFLLVNLSTDNYDNILIGWASLPKLNKTILANFGNSTYCLGENARNNTLIGIWGWKLTDGGKNSSCVGQEYPTFSNYWDDNGSVLGSGVGHFNVSVLNTNGSVYLEINNSNYSADLIGGIYNVSVDFSNTGNYIYQWISWGADALHGYNVSGERSYVVNTSTPANTCTFMNGNWNINCYDNCTITTNTDVLNYNVTIRGKGRFVLDANITNYQWLFVDGLNNTDICSVYQLNGNAFRHG